MGFSFFFLVSYLPCTCKGRAYTDSAAGCPSLRPREPSRGFAESEKKKKKKDGLIGRKEEHNVGG